MAPVMRLKVVNVFLKIKPPDSVKAEAEILYIYQNMILNTVQNNGRLE